jgi:hypothetical protein
MDSTASPKMKTLEGEGVGMHSLAHSTLVVEGCARTLGCGPGRLTSKSITHTYLYKPNNKLVNVATLALGSRPRQKGLQGCGPKGSLGVTSETPGSARECEGVSLHTPRSARECEGVSLHTPRATPTWGEGVPVDSRNFREPFEGSKLNGLWRSLYHWKALGT